MNYEASKQLTDSRFKRLVAVQRTKFEEMLTVLKTVISAPISEIILRADSSSLKPGTVWISLTCSWYS